MTTDSPTTDIARVEERLNKLPAPGTLPSSEGMASLHLADLMRVTGKLPEHMATPRQMFISWPCELSPEALAEMWRDVEGVSRADVLAIYNDPRLDIERQQYQFQQLKESKYPDYGDADYRVNSLLRQIGNIQTRLDTINARWRDATESYTAYGMEFRRVAPNSALARLGRMEVDYLNLLSELYEQLDILRGTGNKKPIGDEAISAAERRLAQFRQKHQQANVNVTVINDNRTQIVNTPPTPNGPSQSREVLNGRMPSILPALETPLSSATNT